MEIVYIILKLGICLILTAIPFWVIRNRHRTEDVFSMLEPVEEFQILEYTPNPDMTTDEPVTVAIFADPSYAEFWKNTFQEEGINCFIYDAGECQVRGYLHRRIELKTKAEDAKRAIELLKEVVE